MSRHNSGFKIAVAMSGGLDSSVAAAILVERRAQVVGVTFKMWDYAENARSRAQVEKAKVVCCHLGIEHHLLDLDAGFKANVVDPFIRGYMNGLTPSPCVICNEKIKFGMLLEQVLQLGCGKLATGHYARVCESGGRFSLHRSPNATKNQAYFLHRLTQRQLALILFPLDGFGSKDDVRAYSEARGLPPATGEESQDLCFVSNDKYSEFIESHCPQAGESGKIVDSDGRELGRHKGIHRYTVGQRRGLGVASTEPLYITNIDAQSGVITLGIRAEAMGRSCGLSDVNWISGTPPDTTQLYTAQIRYRHDPASARVSIDTRGRVRLEFSEPQFGITPGQAAVVYNGNELMGGGWIEAGSVH